MKMSFILMALTFTTLSLAQVSPMRDYESSEHSKKDLNIYWNTVKSVSDKMKQNDCFKRAHLWSYKLEKEHNVKSKKVFIHYTDKFNKELDDLGNRGVGLIFRRLFSSNVGWDFHVAPVVNIGGQDFVLDPKLRDRPTTVKEFTSYLSSRGEKLLKQRQLDIIKGLRKLRNKLAQTPDSLGRMKYQTEINELEKKLKYLGVSDKENEKITITCKQVKHISEFDLNQENEWCFYQFASMYYYGPLQLRYLNYGDIPVDKRLPVRDRKYHTQQYYNDGELFINTDWDYNELEQSFDEFTLSNRISNLKDL